MKRSAMFSLALLVTLPLMGLASISAGERFDNDPKHQLPRPDKNPADMTKPVKVFILLGQSNMFGMGDVEPNTSKGTLAYLTTKERRYPYLIDDAGKWTARSDVRYSPSASRSGSIAYTLTFGEIRAIT